MSLVNFSRSATVSVAFVCTLTACGGGGGGDSTPNAQNTAVLETNTDNRAIIEATNSNFAAETVSVSLVGAGPQITTSPALKLANGQPVTRIDDLPEGITNSAWMKKSSGRLPLRVLLAPGTYTLSRAWTWTPAQSGRQDSPVYIEAQTQGTVTISGALHTVIPQSEHGGSARVTISGSRVGTTTFDQLWVNEERAVRARTPNVGNFFYVQKAVESWGGQSTIGNTAVNRQAFSGVAESMAPLTNLTTAEKSAAVLVALQNWTTSHHRIEALNGNDVRVSPAARWAFLRFGTSQRYFIENVPSALDAEGEWYLHPTTRTLSYLPKMTQRTGAITFDIPNQTQLLSLQGDATNNKWVEYINFRGLKFKFASLPMPSEGLVDMQAAVDIGAAIQMDSARSVTLSDCEVSKVGGYAIWLRSNVRYISVSGCEIYDTGAGGIKVGLTNQPNVTTATGYNTLKYNKIHKTGFQFPAGVGIWIGQSGNNTVEDNFIGDTTYSGISVGWNWGYGPSLARNNQINRNYLQNIMQGALSDGSAIYTLGVSPGTEIKGNVIRGVRAYNYYGSGGWGIYNDEGSSNILIDSNIITDTDHGGYMQNYGSNITVSNNVFAYGQYAEVQVAKSETSQQAAFSNNRFIPMLSSFLSYGVRAPLPKVTYSNNKVSSQLFSTLAVPGDCTSCSMDSSLKISSSAAYSIPVVTDAGGVVKLPNQIARKWDAKELSVAQSPAPFWSMGTGYSFNAAQIDLGAIPFGMTAIPKDRPDLLSVMQEQSNGEKSLTFNDSPSVSNKWEPYGMILTDYTSGTTSVSFTVKVDSASEFLHEWRDYRGSPYKVGPAVTFSGARGVMIKNQVVAPLPVGQWVKVTITASQGRNPRWSMIIAYPDDTVKTLVDLPPQDAEWTATKAIFFISNASTHSITRVREWTIDNQP